MTQAYCVKCRKMVEIKDPKRTVFKNGRPAIAGTCPISDTKVFKIVKWQDDPIYALEIAIAREKKAHEFYLSAADKTEDKDGKKMLKWLAREEEWHEGGLQKQLKALLGKKGYEEWQEKGTIVKNTDIAQASEIAHTREATSYKHITRGEVSALRTAMRAEKKAMDFYQRCSDITTDSNAKSMFESLAKQEEGHFKLLEREMEIVTKHKRYFLLPWFL
ncbi:ferritin family protein [Chloroflexota bacterium]